MQAFLYYHETGTFDRRDLLGEGMPLRNVFVESTATLVVVRVRGSFLADQQGSVSLLASAAGRRLLDQQVPIDDLFTEKDGVSVPFLVHGTGGCGDLELVASVTWGDGETASKATHIPFLCGD